MNSVKSLCYVAALVLLLFASWAALYRAPLNERAPIHPGWLGLAFFVAAWLIP